MKKALIVCIIGTLLISFCGCNDTKNSSVNSEETLPSTHATTTTPAITTTVEQTVAPDTTTVTEAERVYPKLTKLNSDKLMSNDKMFSLTYSFSTITPKVNEPFTVTTVFKNETDNTFHVGFDEQLKAPVMFAIIKEGEIWGYEGNFTAFNSVISARQVFSDTSNVTLKEKGRYLVLIVADFNRSILPGEDTSVYPSQMVSKDSIHSTTTPGMYMIEVK